MLSFRAIARTEQLMCKPHMILAVDVYQTQSHRVRSSKIGYIYAPLGGQLDIDDVINGAPPCLLDYLLIADDGNPGIAEHVVYVFK